MWSELSQYGHLINGPQLKVFFGSQSFHREQLNSSQYFTHRLHQVHGKKVIKASEQIFNADAHWINQKNHILLIKTADCMPVFLSDKSGSFISAIHIGWRGLAQKILSETLRSIPNTENLELYLGPHIQKENFCLDPTSTEELLNPHSLNIKEAQRLGILSKALWRKDQYSIDLKKILKIEAQSQNIQFNYCSPIDTYNSVNHYSHRRNPYSNGRQWSFAMLA